jgi:hypothetical protein
MVSATSAAVLPRVRWCWLWNAKADVVWNLLPFWACLAGAVLLFGARNLGDVTHNPLMNFDFRGREVHLMVVALYFYGPLVDAPHLWATVARTYTDREEWAARRRLFVMSLLWFVVGPAFLVFPYIVRWLVPSAPPGLENAFWLVWSNFFMFYALFHINKQHWGFISLYKRKNGDTADPVENRADKWFFYVAIWTPYAAMMSAPWYRDFDGQPVLGSTLPLFGTTLGAVVHAACHATFVAACIAYVGFQAERWSRGATRNGPKLTYLATIIPLNYLAFAVHPLLAALWVMITGLGHCAQYHRVVWAYGASKYAGKRSEGGGRSLPSAIFESPWLYAALGIAFGLVTMQGPGSGAFKHAAASLLQAGFFSHLFSLDSQHGLDLGTKMAAAFVGGVRLHHFYVDSKIWRVSKSAALAKNLSV